MNPDTTIKPELEIVCPQAQDLTFQTDSNGTHIYPVLAVPPVSQAQLRRVSGQDGQTTIFLNYGGRDIITISYVDQPGHFYNMRHFSDGSMQTSPLIQQFYISATGTEEKAGTQAVLTIHLKEDALCLRPGRARGNQAVLAQHGRPLIYGANGFYGIWEDLLIEWYGSQWHWNTSCLEQCTDGSSKASFSFEITRRPFILLLRPHYYSQHLGYKYYQPWLWRPDTKPVSGWCSWEAYYDHVTEKDIRQVAASIAALKEYGLEYLQLDDGFEPEPKPPAPDDQIYDSWIRTNAKFPGGHQAIVDAVCESGLVPGIWTNASVSNEHVANTGLCMAENGQAFRGDWLQFIMTCEPQMLREQVLPYYQFLSQAGYRYFKTDAIRHLSFDGLQECVRRGLLTDDEASLRYRAFLQTARDGMGPDAYFLICWGIQTEGIGLADACRIATDANASWNSVLMQICETARWFFAQRILFTTDPDHICLRTSIPWARTLASLVSLTGSLYMLSDQPECYDQPRLEIIQKTLPALSVFTAETGAVDYSTPAFCRMKQIKEPLDVSRATIWDKPEDGIFGSLWCTHFNEQDRTWAVAHRIGLLPLPETAISVEDLGLDPTLQYAVYDFWEELFLGIHRNTIPFSALALGQNQVLGITPVLSDAPALIGSNRHISMDAVSIRYDMAISGRMNLKLTGIPGEEFRYSFYSPSKMSLIKCCGGECAIEIHGVITRLTVSFNQRDMDVILSY